MKFHKRLFLLNFGFLALLFLGFIGLGVWFWQGSLEESINGVGQMTPEGHLRRVMSPAGGIVAKLYVKENQTVKAGQVLMELDPEASLLEQGGFSQQLSLIQQETSSLKTAYTGQGPSTDPWVEASRQTLKAQMDDASLNIQKAEHHYKEALEKQNQVQTVLNNSEALLQQYRNLYQEGGLAEKDLRLYEQQVLEKRGELAFVSEAVKASRLELEQSKQRPTALMGTYQRDILDRLSSHQQEIARLSSDVARSSLQTKRHVIVAPIDGVVNEQTVRGPGEVVSVGQALVTIVPKEAPMVAEVHVTNHDLSYIRLHQRAALRLEAFPYQHFGRLFGTVESISPSALVAEAPSTTPDGRPSRVSAGSYYLVRIRPDKTVMTGLDGQKYPFRSGMTVMADIITREKNILSFITDPIHLRLDRAFRDPTSR